VRSSVLQLMREDSERYWTAATLARDLGFRLDSLSRCLHRMVAAKQLGRVRGIGPRGGYGYYVLWSC
jgi:hypothetical protein